MPHPLDAEAYIPARLRTIAGDYARGAINRRQLVRQLTSYIAYIKAHTPCPTFAPKHKPPSAP